MTITGTAVDLRDLMSRMANGVAIVTTDGTAGRFGLTVSSMCSVSLDPPTFLVCVNHRGPLGPAVREHGRFAMNVLADHHVELAERFAGRGDPATNYTFDARWHANGNGSPWLADALAVFDCSVERVMDVGTHLVLLGRIRACGGTSTEPLVYGHRRYGRYLQSPAERSRAG